MSEGAFDVAVDGATLTLRRPKMGELDLVGLQRGVRMFFTYQKRIADLEAAGGEGVSDKIDQAIQVGNDALMKLRERVRSGLGKIVETIVIPVSRVAALAPSAASANGRDLALAWLDQGPEGDACTRALELSAALLEQLLPVAPLGK
jgi:hypothetical protein